MTLSPRRAKVLADALRALASGDARRFDDTLWLGLGDGCAEVYADLVRMGCLANPADLHSLRLTDKGLAFLKMLLNQTSRIPSVHRPVRGVAPVV
jgi:hypothetical protein